MRGVSFDGSLFLSTPSARRATSESYGNIPTIAISIHALREEGDEHRRAEMGTHQHFYPRPPRGGRHNRRMTSWGGILFLSTPSARRATAWPTKNPLWGG